MNRDAYVLAAMAAAGAEARFDPVRLQKFFFLLDRELDGECGCPHFQFRPHRHGPFDPALYLLVEDLAGDGLVLVDEQRRYRQYGLTADGVKRGTRAAAAMPEHVQVCFRAASAWVLSLEFRELLASIHEYAPDMASPSAMPRARTPERRESPVATFLGGMAYAFDWTAYANGRKRVPSAAERLGEYWAAVGDYLRDAMDREAMRIERPTGAAKP